ncbi:MAG: ABC transporter substrate-binding protein [Deltaproteobacteria bacterium]|nr:ABC transporter substrate-binding protein [Deltaproteobacteria bacterium]
MHPRAISIYHSPDADDAFMFFAIAEGHVKDVRYKISLHTSDVESLNNRARNEQLDVTAISAHAIAYLDDRYCVLDAGSSFAGSDYGPVLAASRPIIWSKTPRIAVPGALTTAALALQIFLHDIGAESELVPVNFDDVQKFILEGKVDGGILIHEGQLTHKEHGMICEVNLGEWWFKQYGRLLPLGLNAASLALGSETLGGVKELVARSIQYGLEHRPEALRFASEFRRGLSAEHLDRFVSWYVNDRSVSLGEDGREAIRFLLERGFECGAISRPVNPTFI